ncbi:MAG: hypothetical protein RRY61_04860 [Bacteroidales bacterium]
MDRKERLVLLNKEVKEIGNLLAGISEYDKIPGVLLEMLHDKAVGLVEGINALSAVPQPNRTDERISSSVQFEVKSNSPVASPAEQPQKAVQPEIVSEPTDRNVQEPVKPVEPKEFFSKVFQKFSSSETKSVHHATDIRKLMTLNDRFLFQRELFHGDVGMMNFVLDQMNEFESPAQAHAFLQKEFNWEPEAVGVTEFNALLEQYFNSKNI